MKVMGVLIFSMAAASALAACASQPRFEALPLAGTTWSVKKYLSGETGLREPLADAELFAEFDDGGNVAGSAGCNSFSGTYEASGEKITIGSLIRTLKACLQPEGVMEQEDAFLEVLAAAERYQIQGDTLVLFDGQGNRLIEFQAGE